MECSFQHLTTPWMRLSSRRLLSDIVYNTDERAAVDENSIPIFSEESAALTEFVERLRAWNEYLRLRNTNS